MISISHPVAFAAALSGAHGTPLYDLLAAHAAEFADPALKDQTQILVIRPDTTEQDIIDEVGFSPLVNSIDGTRYGAKHFHPHSDWLERRPGGWFEMIVTVGNDGFAFILLIEDAEGAIPELRAMCGALAA